jgi:hypothetical protein
MILKVVRTEVITHKDLQIGEFYLVGAKNVDGSLYHPLDNQTWDQGFIRGKKDFEEDVIIEDGEVVFRCHFEMVEP